jgi:tRNA(Ile)-lysidine synthase
MINWKDLFQTLPKSIAIAVSGGADSFALLHMAQQSGAKIIALTVDHQLRSGSTDEAQMVAHWCRENNIEHHILPWHGEKPKSALQANARNARRRLLCDKCKELGIENLLLAHQADDQAETMLMRLQRGTGLKGLRAMQAVTRDKITGVRIIRPLLEMRRHELREYCLTNDLPFIDDPSNENPFFERIRIRHVLDKFPKLISGMARSAVRLQRADDTLQFLAKQWTDTHLPLSESDGSWLTSDFLILPDELRIRILEIICDGLDLLQLEKLDKALQKQDFPGITFGPYWIKPKLTNKQPGFLVTKAPARH